MAFCLPPAPGPVVITSSFFKISITWDPPDVRNGIIIAYEVSYRPASDLQTITTMNTTDLDTSFTTESGLELGTAYIFTVTAFTGSGRGEIATASISTLARPRKIRALCLTSTHTGIQYSYDISFSQCMYVYSRSLTAAVQGVEVTALNATAVTVSWNALVIPDFSIDHYTVLYSRVESQRRRNQDGAFSAQFPSTATSCVIAGLDSPATYQFQVFANGTADGTPLQGEISSRFIFTIDGEYHYLFPSHNICIIMSDHICPPTMATHHCRGDVSISFTIDSEYNIVTSSPHIIIITCSECSHIIPWTA